MLEDKQMSRQTRVILTLDGAHVPLRGSMFMFLSDLIGP